MKKVYLLMNEVIDDRFVVAVFSSLKKAEEAKEWLIANDTFYHKYPEDLTIEFWELNGEQIY